MNEEVKVGNFNKPARRPVPAAKAVAEVETGGATNDDVVAKLDEVLKFMQAIDWKMWVYLKANNYID
jgi:hypothetical protein